MMRRRAAHLAQRENFNLKVAALVLHFQLVAHMNLARGLGLMPVGENAAQVASFRRQRPSLEEARRPQPFVNANGIHEAIVVQKDALALKYTGPWEQPCQASWPGRGRRWR
jgi:hypothetical protein